MDDLPLTNRAIMFATQAMAHDRHKDMEHEARALAIEELSRCFIVAYQAGYEDGSSPGLRFKRR